MILRLHHLGEKFQKPEPMPSAAQKVKEEYHYPEITLNSQQIEGIKDLKVGERTKLVIEAEVLAAGKGHGMYDSADENEGDVWVKFCLKMGAVEGEKEDEDETMDGAFSSSMREEMNARSRPASSFYKG